MISEVLPIAFILALITNANVSKIVTTVLVLKFLNKYLTDGFFYCNSSKIFS